MLRTYFPGVIAMAAIVVASNILVQFLFGQWLTWGAFTYPLAFLVTDVMNRVYGEKPARMVVLCGFVVGVICSLIGTQIMGEFGPLVTLRIAIASGSAFLVAQLLDVSIFSALRGGQWWRAPLVSTTSLCGLPEREPESPAIEDACPRAIYDTPRRGRAGD